MSGSTVCEFTDPVAFGASFQDANVELTVIGPGDFHAQRIRMDLPWSRILICHEALPAIAHVALRPNCACIAFPTHEGESAIADGARVAMGDVMFWPAASRFYVRTPANATFACILFNPKNWTGKNLAQKGARVELPNDCRMMRPSWHAMRRLLRLCARAKQAVLDTPDLLRHEGVAGELEWALIDAAAACLAVENQLAGWRTWRCHSGIMGRFGNILRETADQNPTISELCAAVGVPPRTLGTCCREHLAMGPRQYLTLRRQNRARRATRQADGA
jgi:AraC-like DNA-binding protein